MMERDHFRILCVNEKILLKCILQKQEESVDWIELALRTVKSAGAGVYGNVLSEV
jgi:bacterioferritin (cytochrome b1)